jgi:hypothetical protein
VRAEYPFEGFSGGLKLEADPSLVGPEFALSCQDVAYDRRGGVRERDGTVDLLAADAGAQVDSVIGWEKTGGRYYVGGAGNLLVGWDSAGGIVDVDISATANPHRFVKYGSPATELVFILNGTDVAKTFDGAAIAVAGVGGAGMANRGKGKYGCVWENRLVLARFPGSGNADSPSSVQISDPLDHTSWPANNFLRVRPGDGEEITGVAEWGGQLFIFKPTKFAVYSSVTTDAAGNAVFQGRTYDFGIGAAGPVESGRDGVYFVARDGVYRVTGGEAPTCISDAIEPMFRTAVPDYFTFGGGAAINQGQLEKARFEWMEERLHLAYTDANGSTNNQVLVWDSRTGAWARWAIPAKDLSQLRRSSGQPELVCAVDEQLRAVRKGATNDAGVAISSHHLSGFTNFGEQGTKVLRQTAVWAEGTFYWGVARDFGQANVKKLVTIGGASDVWGDGTDPGDTWGDGSGDDIWGPSSLIGREVVRPGTVRGNHFAFSIENNLLNSPWAIHRLVHYSPGRRPRPIEVP